MASAATVLALPGGGRRNRRLPGGGLALQRQRGGVGWTGGLGEWCFVFETASPRLIRKGKRSELVGLSNFNEGADFCRETLIVLDVWDLRRTEETVGGRQEADTHRINHNKPTTPNHHRNLLPLQTPSFKLQFNTKFRSSRQQSTQSNTKTPRRLYHTYPFHSHYLQETLLPQVNLIYPPRSLRFRQETSFSLKIWICSKGLSVRLETLGAPRQRWCLDCLVLGSELSAMSLGRSELGRLGAHSEAKRSAMVLSKEMIEVLLSEDF